MQETWDPAAPSPSNKYLENLDDAVTDDAYTLIKIFEHTTKIVGLLDGAELSPEGRYVAQKRLKKFVQDCYAMIPNAYRPAVEAIVQETMFPEEGAEKGTAEAE